MENDELNSRQLARTWPIPRRGQFERDMKGVAQAWFLSKGYATNPKYPYILADRKKWRQNIILPEVAEYIWDCKRKCESEKISFPLHKHLHNGLSSQAMVFNLLGPLVVRKDYKPLIAALESIGVKCNEGIDEGIFEYEDRSIFNEDSGQPTSLDVAFRSKAVAPKLFLEAKWMEPGFGGCSILEAGDCDSRNPLPERVGCYLDHIQRGYWEVAKKYGIAQLMENEAQCVFALHYQFFRELLFALEHDGVFVLLHDERSPVFEVATGGITRGRIPFLMSFVPKELHDRVATLSTQRLLKHIGESAIHQDWIGDFCLKYGLTVSRR